MAKNKPPKRLFKDPSRVSSYQHDRSPDARMKRLARDHEDVLNAIESTLVRVHQKMPEIDDLVALEALVASRAGTQPDDFASAVLVSALAGSRRADVPDAVWIEALRVVEDSVRRHSGLEPGETAYLQFVEPYVS